MVKFVVACSQFYQHFTSSFCTNLPKKNKKTNCKHKKLCKRLSYKKAPWKCWYNWHLGSISPSCLLKAFTHTDPKSAKKTDDLSVFFALFGSVNTKCWWNWPLESISPTCSQKDLTEADPKSINEWHSSHQFFLRFWDMCA